MSRVSLDSSLPPPFSSLSLPSIVRPPVSSGTFSVPRPFARRARDSLDRTSGLRAEVEPAPLLVFCHKVDIYMYSIVSRAGSSVSSDFHERFEGIGIAGWLHRTADCPCRGVLPDWVIDQVKKLPPASLVCQGMTQASNTYLPWCLLWVYI